MYIATKTYIKIYKYKHRNIQKQATKWARKSLIKKYIFKQVNRLKYTQKANIHQNKSQSQKYFQAQ